MGLYEDMLIERQSCMFCGCDYWPMFFLLYIRNSCYVGSSRVVVCGYLSSPLFLDPDGDDLGQCPSCYFPQEGSMCALLCSYEWCKLTSFCVKSVTGWHRLNQSLPCCDQARGRWQ